MKIGFLSAARARYGAQLSLMSLQGRCFAETRVILDVLIMMLLLRVCVVNQRSSSGSDSCGSYSRRFFRS